MIFSPQEGDEIQFEAYARIENVLTGYWLHALKGKTANTPNAPY